MEEQKLQHCQRERQLMPSLESHLSFSGRAVHEPSQGSAQPSSLSGFVSSLPGSPSLLSTQLVSTFPQFFLRSVSWTLPSFQLSQPSLYASIPPPPHSCLTLPGGCVLWVSPGPHHPLLFFRRHSFIISSLPSNVSCFASSNFLPVFLSINNHLSFCLRFPVALFSEQALHILALC